MEHNSNFNLCTGSVGGYVRYKKGNLIYVFSGPINAPDALSAEIEPILHIVRLISMARFVAVCFYMFKTLRG